MFTQLYEHVKAICEADDDACGLRLYAEMENVQAIQVYTRMGMEREHYTMMKWTKQTSF